MIQFLTLGLLNQVQSGVNLELFFVFVLHQKCFVILNFVMHPESDALADVGSLISLHYHFLFIFLFLLKVIDCIALEFLHPCTYERFELQLFCRTS